MIKKLSNKPVVDANIIQAIEALKPFRGGLWDDNNHDINEFKNQLRDALIVIQNDKCAYCGLELNETGKREIEHFAPKGGPVRPKHLEFMFTIDNLFLSCTLCNSPSKKGNNDIILVKKRKYQKCKFKILHPYYDNYDKHYQWVNEAHKVLISYKTKKGKRTIKMFDLASPKQSMARAKLLKSELFSLPANALELLELVQKYRD
ncbi:hypothetical protein [Vibrio vulnificus]|uniref:hypothetical protein n=1 Tax=Vibrio vulnificus TaxID=672 RepID=UPI003241FDCB